MSSLSQFAGGGAPIPAGTLNGTAALPFIFTDLDLSPLTSGSINARSVQPGAVTAATLATILSLSGKGVISFLACGSVDTTSRTHRIKITLDGTVIFDATSAAVTNIHNYGAVIGSIVTLSTTQRHVSVVPEPIMFNTSLLVEYASSLSETNKTNIAYKYYAR